MRIKRTSLTDFTAAYLTLEEFCTEPEINRYYHPVDIIRLQKHRRMISTEYAYELEE